MPRMSPVVPPALVWLGSPPFYLKTRRNCPARVPARCCHGTVTRRLTAGRTGGLRAHAACCLATHWHAQKVIRNDIRCTVSPLITALIQGCCAALGAGEH
jgi:hypothetical protein